MKSYFIKSSNLGIIIAFWLLMSSSNTILADGVITNGTTVRVHSGTYFVESGNRTIQNGAFFNIWGYTTILGTLTNLGNQDNLVIESDASGTGSLIFNGGQPLATMERYLSDGMWHMITPPTENVISNQYYFSDNPIVWLTNYHEEDDSYEYIYSLNWDMPRGQGYGYWVDESKSDVIIEIHGALGATAFSLNATSEPSLNWSDANHGYNLIGNPYSSAIDFDNEDWVFTNMEESIWVWDPGTENFKTRNTLGAGSMSNGMIPSSQGFFVRASSNNANLVIPVAAKLHNNQALYKSKLQMNEDLEYMILDVYRGNMEIAEDEVWVGFHPLASDAFDNGLDISKLKGNETATQLYFQTIKEAMSCNIMAPLNQEPKSAALYMEAPQESYYTIKVKEINLPSCTQVFLEDLKTGILQDLFIVDSYKFQASPNDLKHRFNILFNTLSTSTESVEKELVNIGAIRKTIYMDFYGDLIDKDKTIELYNTQGQILYNGKIPDGNHYQLKSPIPTQAVFVKIITQTNIITKKLILQ